LPVLACTIYAAVRVPELLWYMVPALILSIPAVLGVSHWFGTFVWNYSEGQLLREQAFEAQQRSRTMNS
jgi:hypothetical protein